MAGREVLMSITNTPPPVSPQQRRRSCHKLVSPEVNTSLDGSRGSGMLTEEHNSQAERRERRKSRILELQKRQLQDPASPVSPTARRSSAPLSGLTSGELTEHYSNCLKLSTENKITPKNAFGLHLIDYFADMVRKKEVESFQVAGTTLDASAKIYAGRVDFIHTETLKVLSGLGRSSEKGGKGGNLELEQEENDDGDDETGTAKRKRRTRKSYTIETNLKNINVSKFDLQFEVDPMFKVMSAAFDEGGASGLLLNNLRCYDDHQLLVLDSSTMVSVTEDRVTGTAEFSTGQSKPVDITTVTDFLSRTKLEDHHICPAFKDFQFTNWDKSEKSILPSTVSEHAFDMDADIEPIAQGDEDADMDVFMDDACSGAALDDDASSCTSEVSHTAGDAGAASLIKSAFKELSSGNTGTLMQILASKPSDFSYFDQSVLRSWAGPTHWRTRPLSKDQKSWVAVKSQKSKGKRPPFRLDFEGETAFEEKAQVSKCTRLTRQTLSRMWSKDKTTLPEDLHYAHDKHFRLFFRPKVLMKPQQQHSVNVDDGLETYDYNNTNDRENFVPGEGMHDDNDDRDEDGEDFGYSAFGAGSDGSSASLFSQNSLLANASTLNASCLAGDRLVAQPFKVAKIDISYAKTAKRIDIRKVKAAMWGILTAKHPEGSGESEAAGGEVPLEAGDKMVSTWRLQEVLEAMPSKVSAQTARNLSVPITFVCLLHLANEKVLNIENVGMDDLIIRQEN